MLINLGSRTAHLIINHDRENKITWVRMSVAGQEFVSSAKCHKADDFNKEMGRKVALSRLLPQTPLSKMERFEVWKKVLPKRVTKSTKEYLWDYTPTIVNGVDCETIPIPEEVQQEITKNLEFGRRGGLESKTIAGTIVNTFKKYLTK